jgi:signal transduction histidine kinase
MWETILSGEVWDAELINRRKSGELYHANQTIAPITDDDGEISHFVGIVAEDTEQWLREQRLSVFNRILRHDIRNGVNVVAGNARRLHEQLEDPELLSQLRQIENRAESLTEISQKVAAVSDLFESDQAEPPVIDLGAMLQEVAAEFEQAHPEATVSVGVREGVTIRATDQLRVAIRELVENAIVHNDRSEPRVEIGVERYAQGDPSSWIEISVADNGPGIPKNERATLQLDEETPLVHGTGIGLWVAYWVTASAGGELTFDIDDGRGSTVTLRLPIGPA